MTGRKGVHELKRSFHGLNDIVLTKNFGLSMTLVLFFGRLELCLSEVEAHADCNAQTSSLGSSNTNIASGKDYSSICESVARLTSISKMTSSCVEVLVQTK